MVLDKRLVAILGVLATTFTVISSLATVRIYSNYFTDEEFGLIGCIIFLVSIIQFQDFGLSTYTTRQCYNGASDTERFRLVIVYLSLVFVATFITLTLFSCVNKISSLNIIFALCAISYAQTSSVYLSNLLVLRGKQLNSYIIQTLFAAALVLGSLAVIYLELRVDKALLIISCVLILKMIFLLSVNNLLFFGLFNKIKSEIKYVLPIIKKSFETYKMNLVVGLGFHADKIIALNLMTISALGGYSIVTQFATGATLFTVSISNYFSSEIVKYNSSRAIPVANTTRLLANIVLPMFIVVTVNIDTILMIWLGNVDLVKQITFPAVLFTAGAMLNALTIPFYGYLIAEKAEKEMKNMFTKLLFVCAPITLFLVSEYSLTGASMSYLIYNLAYLISIFNIIINSKIAKSYVSILCSKITVLEIVLSFAFNAILSIILCELDLQPNLTMILSVFGLLMSIWVFLKINKALYR